MASQDTHRILAPSFSHFAANQFLAYRGSEKPVNTLLKYTMLSGITSIPDTASVTPD